MTCPLYRAAGPAPLGVVALLVMATVSACTDPDRAHRALEQDGMTNIQIGGYAPFMCGESDQFSTSFTATNARGQKVSGAVCSAWMKGATIRYD